MRLLNYITEESYTKEHIPKNFFVVFDVVEAFQHLLKGSISVKGISSSGEIQYQFLDVARDTVLIMDSEKLLKLNKISRVMYDNPHYLVSNDMEALYRIFSKSRNKQGKSGLLFNLLEYLKKYFPADLKYDANYYGLVNYGWDWAEKLPKIKNINTLSKFLFTKITTEFPRKEKRNYNITLRNFDKMLYDALLDIGKIYSDENEWIIKDNALKIPENSVLKILYPKLTPKQMRVVELVKKNITDPNELRKNGVDQEEIIWSRISGQYEIKNIIQYDDIIQKLKDKYKIVKVYKEDFKKEQKDYFDRKK